MRPRRHTLTASRPEAGAILLEVVIALVLFVMAAAIISGGLNMSMQALERIRLQTHARNLAISVLSQMQIGNASFQAGQEPQAFEIPFETWTWEVFSLPVDTSLEDNTTGPQQIEVVIRHPESQLVYRLAQVIRLEETQAAGTFVAQTQPPLTP